MPELKTVVKSAESIKSGELPEDVLKAAEGKDVDKWYYATVETPDRESDVVRVKGLDTDMFRQHGGPIKILVSHRKSPDANNRLPIVGGVTEWVRTTHKSTGLPAMVAGFKFVGTELGKEAKVLADADLLDVSIGFQPIESQPIKGGGVDYTKAAIAEISICTHGMQQFSGAVKAEADEALAEQIKEINVGNVCAIGLLNQIIKRLDDLESVIVDKAEQPEAPVNNPSGTEDETDWTACRNALDALLKSLPTSR